MRVEIITVGKLKSGPERQIYDKYIQRAEVAGKSLGLNRFVFSELIESRAQDSEERKNQEALKILEKASENSLLIVCDENGKNFTSRRFSEKLLEWRDHGAPSLTFVIGGPDGVSGRLKQQAAQLLAFGPMTLPHGIARIVLAEQIYRAITIACGHPYHRD